MSMRRRNDLAQIDSDLLSTSLEVRVSGSLAALPAAPPASAGLPVMLIARRRCSTNVPRSLTEALTLIHAAMLRLGGCPRSIGRRHGRGIAEALLMHVLMPGRCMADASACAMPRVALLWCRHLLGFTV